MGSISVGWWVIIGAFAAFALYVAVSSFLRRRHKSGKEEPQTTTTNSLLR